MAGRAQRHEVSLIVRTAFACRPDVVDQGCLGHSPFLSAQGAEGVGVKELFSDLPPLVVIAFACLWAAVIAFIVFCIQFGVFLTESSVGEEGTAGMGTWPLRFVWQGDSLLRVKRKPGRISRALYGLV